MNINNIYLRESFLTLLIVFITVYLTSCEFCPRSACKLIGENAPLKELTSSDQHVVFEELGTIIVYHGFGCAESNNPEEENVLKVAQSIDLPAYATNATVFLNGWQLQYLNKDHEVLGLGTMIGNISMERNTLKWQAAGVLSDNNFDDAYSWCYRYTIVAWNPANLNLTIDHDDGSCDPNDSSNLLQANFFFDYNDETTTALSSFPSFLQNPDFIGNKTVAILPRGFGFGWSDCNEDHHLSQIGYNLDHSEIFIEQGKKYKKKGQEVTPSLPNNASQVGSGFVSWETSVIFKDNDGRRDYEFAEIVSGLSGNEVETIQPPFSILPGEDECGILSNCVSSNSGIKTEEFVIENVPYLYAIPMLTGWELNYAFYEDEHVTEGGIWIDDWSYDKNTRTLRYKLSSILRDKDDDPDFDSRHKVTILGLRPVADRVTKEKSADLLPFSPMGNTPDAFCRMEQGISQLRVTVKNQGNENAAASKTTVTFRDGAFTLDTPPIPAGGTIDLLFKVPVNCFSPDCSFSITVDSNNQVNELENEANNSTNGSCIG